MTPTATLTPARHTPVSLRRRTLPDRAEIAELNREFERSTPHEIVAWAVGRFGKRLSMTASFADTVLIDIATAVEPDLDVVFLDTGFHFSETLATVRRAMERYSLSLTVLRPDPSARDVWATDPESCCADRKTEPLDRYLVEHADAWMSGVRRADGPARASAPIVSVDRRGLLKLNPIANLDDASHAAYIREHDVLINPLALDGYDSIGCWPCTEPGVGRDGRWAGSIKTECGLHR